MFLLKLLPVLKNLCKTQPYSQSGCNNAQMMLSLHAFGLDRQKKTVSWVDIVKQDRRGTFLKALLTSRSPCSGIHGLASRSFSELL